MRRMRKRVFAVLVVLLAIAVLGSCNWMLSPFNHMSIDGERYALDDLYLLYYGTWNGVHNVDLFLVSDGITLTRFGGSGSGDLLFVEAWSRSADLDAGNYSFSETNTAGTFSIGEAVVGAVIGGGYESGYIVTGGTLDVRNTLGGGYVIEFDFDAVNWSTGASVSIDGRFRGRESDRFDYSGMTWSEHPDTPQKQLQIR